MKKIITIILLVFVAASVAKLIYDGAQKSEPTVALASDEEIVGDQTVVYYFHGNVRCTTCSAIEANTKKAIEAEFGDMLKDGGLSIRVLNMEEPANKGYVDEYKLTNSSVVVSRVVDGKEVKWSRLDTAWDLIGDDAAFIAHIQKETRAVMEGGE